MSGLRVSSAVFDKPGITANPITPNFSIRPEPVSPPFGA